MNLNDFEKYFGLTLKKSYNKIKVFSISNLLKFHMFAYIINMDKSKIFYYKKDDSVFLSKKEFCNKNINKYIRKEKLKKIP